jgi:uncharacterized protein (DUF1015 family)
VRLRSLDGLGGGDRVELIGVVEDRRLGRPRGVAVVMRRHGVQELGTDRRFEAVRALLDHPQAEMDVPEQTALVGGPERRAAPELAHPPDIVQERSREDDVRAEALVQLRRLAHERGHADRVLEQAARVRVVRLRRRQLAEPLPQRRVGREPADDRCQPRVGDLTREELEKALELVGVPAQLRRKARGVVVGGLDRADLELKPVVEALHPPEHADGVALGEAAVEQLDVVPDPSLDAAGRIHELEREIGRALPRRPALLPCDGVDALDGAIGGELGDRAHAVSLGREPVGTLPAMAVVKPFRALRFDESVAGPLETLVAPPYDVITDEQREELKARSPHNVVRLTLPDSEDEAARLLDDWRADGVLVEEPPAVWALEQDYVGPDGVARSRFGIVGSLKVEPYETGTVLPHERTHPGPKEGRLRLLRATRTQLEPIFLLYDGPAPAERPSREPDLEVEGAKLWRLDDPTLVRAFDDKQLLIADGHHRYETALAFAEEEGTPTSAQMLVVLVSTDDPGLEIFPTHRLFSTPRHLEGNGAGGAEVTELTRDGSRVVHGPEGMLDVQLVDTLGHDGISYTADAAEAERRVRDGEAAVAYLLRPTRIEDVFAHARRGEVLPQKTTYFFPKLISGLLFHPV